MTKTRVLTGLSVGLAGLLLTGCGSASPGLAAEVGEHTISVDRVDATTQHMCSALGDGLRGNGQVVPMGVIRQGVLQLLVLAAQARQIAEEYGVEPGPSYRREVAQLRQTAESMPEETREAYVEVMSAQALANAVLDAAGRAKLEAEGMESPTVEEVTQAGTDIFANWPDAHGIEVDPRYGVELRDGALTPADTSLSVAVSEQARQGLEPQPAAAYTQALAAGHRCGD